MQQAIIGFHLDEEQHWVAELACGHDQHVRHTPPWQNRPWVMTKQGRKEKIGKSRTQSGDMDKEKTNYRRKRKNHC